MDLSFEASQNVIPAFVTPIGRFLVPNASDINSGLREAILKRRKESEGVKRTNEGGWHSEDDFFKWPEPEVVELTETIRSGISHLIAYTARRQKFQCEFDLVGWANVSPAGAYHSVHNHAFSHWSGVYYVKTDTSPDLARSRAGNIEFYDPRGSINMMTHPGNSNFGVSMWMAAQEGALLLFPSWLYHGVNPTRDMDERISISFNARITRFAEESS